MNYYNNKKIFKQQMFDSSINVIVFFFSKRRIDKDRIDVHLLLLHRSTHHFRTTLHFIPHDSVHKDSVTKGLLTFGLWLHV